MFQDISIDPLSFWVGFLGGGLFFFLMSRLRQALPEIIRRIREQIQSARESMTAGVDLRFRSDIIRLAQRQHLAAHMFSLEEIALQPFLIAPPPEVNTEQVEALPDIFSQVVPYTPDWPELSAAFGAPRLTLPEALQGGASLALMGNPGSGKSFALAHLAVQMARRQADIGSLRDYLPVYLHAADLVLPLVNEKDILLPLVDGLSQNASPLTLPRLSKYIHEVFAHGKAFLLLDGLDEASPSELEQACVFLVKVLKAYPHTRLVAAVSPENYAGLPGLGLAPVALSTWSTAQQVEFLQRWSDLWDRFIVRQNPERQEVDSLLLTNWLKDSDIFESPLELTLKVWAAYVGDILGAAPEDAIEAYIRRFTAGIPGGSRVLETIAAHNVLNMRSVSPTRELEKLVVGSESPATEAGQPVVEADVLESEPPKEKEKKSKSPPEQAGVSTNLPQLANAGLLVSRRGGRMSVSHPVINAYLAGRAIAGQQDWPVLLEQNTWLGKTLTLRYLSHCTDLSGYIFATGEERQDPTYRQLLQVWQWMRHLPKHLPWRSSVMRKIAALIQDDTLPLSLRGRGVAALASTKDPGAVALFRQFSQHRSASIRQLAILGCGLTGDPKVGPDLVSSLEDIDEIVRFASMLALGVIANSQALDAIAGSLLDGSEEMRRAAAEVLAGLPADGHPALRDGAAMEDLLVRRAVVYGLAKVGQPWANQLLEQMQIEDGQWVVRAAASQAIEELSRPNPCVPKALTPLSETPWLIVFAGKQGVGVTPGEGALELVVQALKYGEENEKLAALEYLSRFGSGDIAHAIYPLLYSNQGQLREAAYQTLWSISGSGAELPSQIQFGLG
jgi:HEAT repeat protein